jgi:hypothetical protein
MQYQLFYFFDFVTLHVSISLDHHQVLTSTIIVLQHHFLYTLQVKLFHVPWSLITYEIT